MSPQAATLDVVKAIRPDITREALRLHQAGATVTEVNRFLASKRVLVIDATVRAWLRRENGES